MLLVAISLYALTIVETIASSVAAWWSKHLVYNWQNWGVDTVMSGYLDMLDFCLFGIRVRRTSSTVVVSRLGDQELSILHWNWRWNLIVLHC